MKSNPQDVIKPGQHLPPHHNTEFGAEDTGNGPIRAEAPEERGVLLSSCSLCGVLIWVLTKQ